MQGSVTIQERPPEICTFSKNGVEILSEKGGEEGQGKLVVSKGVPQGGFGKRRRNK